MSYEIKNKVRKISKRIIQTVSKPKEPCKCGFTEDTHCKAFTDNVWFGCLRSKKNETQIPQD